jgi:hypothetical protein
MSAALSKDPNEEEDRKADFLLAMYKAMWDNINRHVTVLWQAVAVLGATFSVGLIAIRDNPKWPDSIYSDFAAVIQIATACWLIAHAIDSTAWFNRNILIISNIEKYFAKSFDRSDYVHPYMEKDWPGPKQIPRHMVIQGVFGVMVAIASVMLHAFTRIIPVVQSDVCGPTSYVQLSRELPLITLALGVLVCLVLWNATSTERKEFEQKMDAFRMQKD